MHPQQLADVLVGIANKSIARRSAPNVGATRLLLRRDVLLAHIRNGGDPDGNRIDFAMRAAELTAVEGALDHLGLLDSPTVLAPHAACNPKRCDRVGPARV